MLRQVLPAGSERDGQPPVSEPPPVTANFEPPPVPPKQLPTVRPTKRVVNVNHTPRVFPTPMRESKLKEENAWVQKHRQHLHKNKMLFGQNLVGNCVGINQCVGCAAIQDERAVKF